MDIMRPDDHMGRSRISDFNLVPQLAQLCIDAMGLKYHLPVLCLLDSESCRLYSGT